MATKKDDTVTYYSRITVHFATKNLTMAPLILESDGDHLTYKTKDSMVTFEWSRFEKDKPAWVCRRIAIPLYNIAYAEEKIDRIEQTPEVSDD